MVKNNNDILVRIINKVEGSEQLIKEKNLISSVKKSNGDLTQVYEDQTAAQRKRVTVTEKNTKAGREQNVTGMETLAQGPKFQMHYLGIMFGGMALNRAMGNLTATAKEWVGIGELMSTTMGTVMLPATLELLDQAILPLMESLLSMNENTKLTVGISALALQGTGALLSVVGQGALGLSSLKQLGWISSTGANNMGKVAGAAVGLGITIGALYFYADSLKKGDIEASIRSAIIAGGGIAITAGVIGVSAPGAIVLGTIAAIALVSISLATEWKRKKSYDKNAEDLQKELTQPGSYLERSEQRESGNLLGFDYPEGNIVTDIVESGLLKQELDNYIGKGNYNYGESTTSMNTPQLDLTSFQFKAVGGNITNNGLHFLHQGETVLRKDEAQGGGSVSVTYNVNVSDKREFEQMLKTNNQQLVREVRRNSY
jgi:hypothetical protein